jgi:hypothetical protein
MDHPDVTPDETPAATGDPEPGGRPATGPRRGRLVGAAVAVAVVLAAGFTGVAIAADGSPSPTPSASGGHEGGFGHIFGHGRGMRHGRGGMGAPLGGPMMLGLMGGPIRGDLVVPKRGGGYQTIHLQRGAVTAVSGSSLTVRSADGVSETYSVTAKTLVNARRDGIAGIKKGAQVHVLAVGAAGSLRAVQVADLSVLPGRGLRRFDRPPWPDGSAPPTTPGTAEQGSSGI